MVDAITSWNAVVRRGRKCKRSESGRNYQNRTLSASPCMMILIQPGRMYHATSLFSEFFTYFGRDLMLRTECRGLVLFVHQLDYSVREEEPLRFSSRR